MSDDASTDFQALAFDALRRQLRDGKSAEEARAEGMKLGAQMAAEAAKDTKSAELWDKVLGRAEGMLNSLLDRMEASDLRKAAGANPPPKPDGAKAEDTADRLDVNAVLSAISQRPPAKEAAGLLQRAGVGAANLEDVLTHVRGAGNGWPEFLDAEPKWLDDVRAAMADEDAGDAGDASE